MVRPVRGSAPRLNLRQRLGLELGDKEQDAVLGNTLRLQRFDKLGDEDFVVVAVQPARDERVGVIRER